MLQDRPAGSRRRDAAPAATAKGLGSARRGHGEGSLLVLIASLALACAHPALRVAAGAPAQGTTAFPDVRCRVRWNGEWRGAPCGPRPQLQLSAVSDCAVAGGLWLSIDAPAESSLVEQDLPVSLWPGEPASFTSPCFVPPRSQGEPVVVSVRARCATSSDTMSATARCVMP